MKKYLKPAVTFVLIWIILTITQFTFKPPQTKEIAWDQEGKIIREMVHNSPGYFYNLPQKMMTAFYITLSLVALYLFILLLIDAFWERKKSN
jgi:hypothetical protein